MNVFSRALLVGVLVSATAIPSTLAFAQSSDSRPEIVVTGKLQKQWDQGKKMEQEALGHLEKAQEGLKDANEKIVDSQEDRDREQKKAEEASSKFRELTKTAPDFIESSEAKDWADKVREAASDWANSEHEGKDEHEDLRKAMKAQAKAQEKVDKAKEQIAKGREMMALAEQRSQAGSSSSRR